MSDERRSTLLVLGVTGVIILILISTIISSFNKIDVLYLLVVIYYVIRISWTEFKKKDS